MMKHLFALTFLLVSSTALYAGEAEKQLITRWYGALSTVNRAEIADLLSDKAKITLGDLDIEQNKTEFVASLDEWEDAMKGSTIRHAIESDEAGTVTVTVCYKFPDNESLGREIFTFEGEKILTSAQETIAESCETFPE
jgi:hypothetical protein